MNLFDSLVWPDVSVGLLIGCAETWRELDSPGFSLFVSVVRSCPMSPSLEQVTVELSTSPAGGSHGRDRVSLLTWLGSAGTT